ncbi:hypothetical protein F4558_002454 [Micromonospora profundi]|uniref:hypothetical protein n=1 Tax=Micromonospora TaxID=1873 RepID=UPI0012F7E159|nr:MULTISPECIES: hypothetical protein [Micromonospora]NJC12628.1 hypothetical protein [Micromonospora profundi]
MRWDAEWYRENKATAWAVALLTVGWIPVVPQGVMPPARRWGWAWSLWALRCCSRAWCCGTADPSQVVGGDGGCGG